MGIPLGVHSAVWCLGGGSKTTLIMIYYIIILLYTNALGSFGSPEAFYSGGSMTPILGTGDSETPGTDPGIMLPQIVCQFLTLIDSFYG